LLQIAELEAKESLKTKEGELEAQLNKARNELESLKETKADAEAKLDKANTQLIKMQKELRNKEELFNLNVEMGRNEILEYKER